MPSTPNLPGFDFEGIGTESEDDIAQLDTKEIEKSYLWATDWTIGTIINQIDRGNIILDPDFQRRDAWKTERKSRFIESIVLGLPIPQIVLAESKKEKGKFIVVDGKQRLLSIMQFAGGENWTKFSPKGLKLVDLNNKPYENIKESELGFKFENSTIRTVILKNSPSDALINIIFHRLNSNSVALSPQELRQSIMAGPFTKFAENYTQQNLYLSELLGGNGPDFRMRDVELLIRFISFKLYLGTYNGNLKTFIDTTCIDLNKHWKTRENEIKALSESLNSAVNIINNFFGPNAFRKYLPEQGIFEYRFNRAIFDILTYYFSQEDIVSSITANKSQFISSYLELFNNNEFNRSIETTTKSIGSVKMRFTKMHNLVVSFFPQTASLPFSE